MHYPVWQKALAAAKTINQVSELVGYYYEGIRMAARKKDRTAEIEAASAAISGERKLGVLIAAASKAGALAKRGPGKKSGLKKPAKTR
jgi:hypothetical protein